MNQQEANEAAAAPKGTITLGGSVYLVDPVTERHFATLIKFLRSRMPSPFEAIAKDVAALPPHLQEVAVREAVNLKSSGSRELSRSHVESQLYEVEPCAFLCWILIRDNHPGLSLETLTAAVRESGTETVLASLYEAASLKALEKKTSKPA